MLRKQERGIWLLPIHELNYVTLAINKLSGDITRITCQLALDLNQLLQMWPTIWKPTICKKMRFCRMGFGCHQNFFFQIFFLSFYESMIFLCSFVIFHCNTMLFNYCNDREKEETPVLASFVHGLTVIINQLKSTGCEQSPALSSHV